MAVFSGQRTLWGRLSFRELVFPPSGCILGGTFAYWKSSHPLLKADTRIPFPEWNSWVENWAVSAYPETTHLNLFLPAGSPYAAHHSEVFTHSWLHRLRGWSRFHINYLSRESFLFIQWFRCQGKNPAYDFHGMISFSFAFPLSFSCRSFSALIITCQLELCTPHHLPTISFMWWCVPVRWEHEPSLTWTVMEALLKVVITQQS